MPSLHKDDARSKKIIFVSNCILNSNNKVFEFARYAGAFREVVEILMFYDLGIMQMPCPEVLYMGNQRWWTSNNLYDNAGFRRFCRELAVREVDYVENYHKVGYSVVGILSCDGSPTCGVNLTSYCEDWGGRPKEIPRRLINKPGVYIEELCKEFEARDLEVPKLLSLCMDDRDRTNQQCIEDLRTELEKI